MERTSVALLSDLLADLFNPPSLDMFLARYPALTKARGTSAPGIEPNLTFFIVATALQQHGLVPDPLVSLLRAEYPHQLTKLNSFIRAFAIQETATLLTQVDPSQLSEWVRLEAPSSLDRRLRDKTKDAYAVATHLPMLPPEERTNALTSIRSLWQEHSIEADALERIIGLWEKVSAPTPSFTTTSSSRLDVDQEEEAPRQPPNDMFQFKLTLDRTVVWGKLLACCAEPSHQLLVVRGDPQQSLQLFRSRIQRYLSDRHRPHAVYNFGPGGDHRPATTEAAWEELLIEGLGLGPAHYTLKRAILRATSQEPVLCIVGMNSPLHFGDDSLTHDDLTGLIDFILSLPGRLPPINERAPRPIRILMPIQVDPLNGLLDPVFRALYEASQRAERLAQARTPPIALKAEFVGALDTPQFSELEEPIATRAWRQHHRVLTADEWHNLQEAYRRALATRLPFVGLAESLWEALPIWMKEIE